MKKAGMIRRICAVLALLTCLSWMLVACAESGEPIPYTAGEHIHAYGHWVDAAPENEGAPVTKEVRYCKVCHLEEVREKE